MPISICKKNLGQYVILIFVMLKTRPVQTADGLNNCGLKMLKQFKVLV